ncbi:hypothetical protein [Micromonospora sp. NPDC049662]|uniref:hypothetical protein n=1 Tax=Micromonospora sp. NPDC049662 TaxID=3155397 RepID=UPI003443CEC4
MITDEERRLGGVPDRAEVDVDGEARRLLHRAERDPRLAGLLDRIADELHTRLRTDVQDGTSPGAVGDVLAARHRLVLRMVRRYRAVGAQDGQFGAAVMLAGVHRFGLSDRSRSL